METYVTLPILGNNGLYKKDAVANAVNCIS